MADILALSWDRRRLSGLEISPSSAGPRVLNGFSVDWPEQTPTATWLRETLRRHGISARHVALALPREDAVLRLLELPVVSEEEMPTLVRFQASARSAQSLDQLLLDYLPLPLREHVSQVDVWLATTTLTTIAPIRALLTEAGLDLTQLTISSLCLTELIARGEAKQSLDPANASLIVLRDGARMELAVISQRQLIAAHAVKWSSEHEIPPVAKMLAEVSRLLVQVQAWLPEGTLQRAWVIGEDADVGDLPQAIGQRWKCPVQRFDPWQDSSISLGTTKLEGPASQFAIAAGLALIQAGHLTPKLDLLHPRQPPPKRDPRKPIIAAASAAALLVTALGTAVFQQSLASYDRKIEDLRSKETDLKNELDRGKQILETAKTIKTWQSRSVNQLDQMTELHQLMSGTDRLIIGDYHYNNSTGNIIGKLHTTGMARDRDDTERFTSTLADQAKFKVYTRSPTGLSHDHDYPSRLEVDAEVVPVTQKPAPAAKPGQTAPSAKEGKSK
jgi:Tfp pilus assembly PilM family ATPase